MPLTFVSQNSFVGTKPRWSTVTPSSSRPMPLPRGFMPTATSTTSASTFCCLPSTVTTTETEPSALFSYFSARAPAEDDQALRDLLQAHGLARADDLLAVELEARHLNRGRAGCDHDRLLGF